ncbi:alpha/beta hydrolase [Rhodococcus sp. P1Y]|uniref:alpha/beta hydrolase n=1 Tax=Rhodococcus sp. P1Y TaxID=1302308 RepID=UPI001F4707B7|nr:alpha/beta hydrolase [Rhodococcus sp. P1Y]
MIDRFGGAMSELSVVELRRLLDENTRPVVSPIHSQEDALVPTAEVDVPVRVYRPHGGEGLGVVQWMHGGGFTVGSLNQNDEYLRKLSVATNAVVVSVDYRLAPEHPHPAAMDDCAAVWKWIARGPDALDGVDVARCVLAGESAGGTMAMVLAHRAAERELKTPVAVVNIYGPPDMIVSNPECATGALTVEDCRFFWDMYSDPAQRTDPRVCPARAVRVDHLPPHYFAVPEVDVMRESIEKYAARLAAAGVDVRTRTYRGMMHGFATMTAELQPARVLFDDLSAYVRASLETESPSEGTDEVSARAQ